MTKEEISMMLRPAKDEIIRTHFGQASCDPHATLMAVHDFESFSRVMNARFTRRTRSDRLRRLYQLYLAISKTRLSLSKHLLEQFKRTIPGYEHVSFFYFIQDIEELRSAGIVIVSTPILNALKAVEKNRQALKELQEFDEGSESIFQLHDPLESALIDYRVHQTPPTVWPNV